MRQVLIVYGTTEGQTRKIAQFVADEATKRGYGAVLHDATAAPEDLDPRGFDKVIVAASVHMDRHQAAVEHFVLRHLPALRDAQCAFLSVSLSAAGDSEDEYVAWEYARKFLFDVGWQPAHTQIVAGALRFTEHDFFKRWMMKLLAKRKGAPRDSGRDYEYTDWEGLKRFLNEYLGPAITT